MNGSFVPFFASGGDFIQANKNQPFRFGSVNMDAAESLLNMFSATDFVAGLELPTQPLNYPNGYLTNSNANSAQYLFLLPKFFDPALGIFGENTKQPVTLGELLTLPSLPMTNAYAGPVLVITGCKFPPSLITLPVPIPLLSQHF